MRLGLILGILGLTALLFFTAVQTNTEAAKAQVQALSTQFTADHAARAQEAAARIDDLETQIADLNVAQETRVAEIARITAAAANLPALEAQNAELSETVVKLRSEMQDLSANEAETARLASENRTMSDLIASLENDLAETRAGNTGDAELAAQKDALTQELAEVRAELATLSDAAVQNAALQSELAGLRQAATDAETQVQGLNASIAMYESDKLALEVKLTELETAMAAAPAQPDALLESELAALQALVDEKAAALAVADESIEALTLEVASLVNIEDQIVDTESMIASLRSDIAVRDLAITELRAQTQTQPQTGGNASLLFCQDRSATALVGGGITFQSGTTTLDHGAIAQLETIAAIAVDCANNGLMLEIEGHTDSEGGTASNLLLSNGRAKAVYDFLAQRGVPPAAMRSVGFGKSDPIADNATADGRAKNERIEFDWEPS